MARSNERSAKVIDRPGRDRAHQLHPGAERGPLITAFGGRFWPKMAIPSAGTPVSLNGAVLPCHLNARSPTGRRQDLPKKLSSKRASNRSVNKLPSGDSMATSCGERVSRLRPMPFLAAAGAERARSRMVGGFIRPGAARECGWNFVGIISEKLMISDQAASSIG